MFAVLARQLDSDHAVTEVREPGDPSYVEQHLRTVLGTVHGEHQRRQPADADGPASTWVLETGRTFVLFWQNMDPPRVTNWVADSG